MPNIGESSLWRRVRRLSAEDRPSSSWLADFDKGALIVKAFTRPPASLVDHLEALIAVQHPNLPDYWPLVHSKETVHLVRPYYKGTDLVGHKIECLQWRVWAQTMLEALQPIHSQGLRHGDLKPSNVILTDERLVLVDPCYDQEHLATLRYAAPEVTGLVSASPSPASDLYSLGLLLAELALGAPVHQAADLNTLLKQHLKPLPARPPEGYTFKDWEWLGRLCHPQPAQRYSTVSAALADLLDIALDPGKVLGTQDHTAELRRPSWCGRAEELQVLLSSLEDKQIKAVRLSAPSGMGKSALLREFRRRMPPELEVIALPSDPDDRTKPAEILAAHLGAAGTSCDELSSRLNRRPSGVLMFDDLQWATPTTAELVHSLYAQLTEHWTLVLAHRPVEADWPAERTLHLSPLKKSETAALCRSMLGPSSSDLTGRVHELSQGSPLMAEAVIRGLWERGDLSNDGQVWQLGSGVEAQVSLASSFILRERLLHLEDDLRRALQLGALCGRRFDRDWLQPLISVDMDEVAAELAQRYLVFSHGDGTVEFVHDKIREEALSQVSAQQAVDHHLALLDILERDFADQYQQMVHHARMTQSQTRAWEPARLGALQSLEKKRWQSAAELLEIALEDPGLDRRERFELGLRWAECESSMGRPLRVLEVVDSIRCHARIPNEHAKLDFVSLWSFAGGSDSEIRHKLLLQAASRIGEPTKVGPRQFLAEIFRPVFSRLAGQATIGDPDWHYQYLFNYMQNAFECGNDIGMMYAMVAGWSRARYFRGRGSRDLAALMQVQVGGILSVTGFHQLAHRQMRSILPTLPKLRSDIRGLVHFRTLMPYSGSGQLWEALRAIQTGYRYLEPVGFDARTVIQFQACFLLMLGRRKEAVTCIRRYELLRSSANDYINNAAINITRSLAGIKADLDTVGQSNDPKSKFYLLDRLALGLQHFQRYQMTEAILALREAASLKGIGPSFYTGMPANWLTTAYRYLIERLPNEAWALKKRLLSLAQKSARLALKWGNRFPLTLPHALREQAMIANLLGDPKAARRYFRRSEQEAVKIGMPFEIAWTVYCRARVAEAAGWPEADPEITRRTREFLASFEYFVPGLESAVKAAQATTPLPAHTDRFQSLLMWGRRIALTTDTEQIYATLHQAATDLLRTDQVAVLNTDLEVLVGQATFSREAARKAIAGQVPDLDHSTVTKHIASAVYRPIRSHQGDICCLLVASHTEMESLYDDDSTTLASHLVAVTEAALGNAHAFATEQQLQQQAQQQADTFQGLFRDSSLALAVCDSRGLFVQTNTRFAESFGRPQRIQHAVPTSDRPTLIRLMRSGGTEELRYLDPNTAVHWAQLTVTLLPADEILFSFLDVTTERRHYLEQLEAVEQRLLASELHDSLSAPLVALHMRLQLAQAKGEKLDPASLAQIKAEALAARERVLGVEQLLRRVPDEENFETDLKAYLESIGELKIDLQYNLSRPPQGLACGFLFRIIAEAVTNVRRHAHTDYCEVRLWNQDETLHCEINDQGRGFEPTATTRRGLSNIRHRVELLGGSLQIQSKPGNGTSIFVHIPEGAAFAITPPPSTP